MRQLQLQPVAMSGPDVSDWQTFLKGRHLFPSTVDGQFGPKSDAATRAYQTCSGLTSDGIVGPGTLARAVSDGYQSTTGANRAGMDANVDCSAFAGRLPAAGMQFVARYYSDNPKKTLTRAETLALSAAGITLVAVFENSNNSAAAFSAAVGASQAVKALALAAAMGQPAGTAIYFAVDYDATPADVSGPISDYFGAIQAALAAAPVRYLVGVYGSGFTCGTLRDAGLAQFTWLAQSIGFRDYSSFRAHADIVQLAPERTILSGGLSIDDDIAQSVEFGGFRAGKAHTATTPST